MKTIQIRTRFYGSTYLARGGGKQASCTMGEDEAVAALCRKLRLPWRAVRQVREIDFERSHDEAGEWVVELPEAPPKEKEQPA